MRSPFRSSAARHSPTQAVLHERGKGRRPPPLDFEASVGTPVLDGKEAQTIDLKLKRGRYALVCFIPDRAGSPPHVALGMLNEVAVK